MNQIVKFTDDSGNLPANADELIKGLQNVTSAIQSVAGGIPYLRLLRSGVFAYGPENIEPEPESVWAVNPYSITHGFACWGDGELLGERMVPFNQRAPNRAELPDYGFEWDQQFGMQLQCLTGEDEDTVVSYRGTSTGLRNAAKKLIDQIIAQVQRDPEHIVPAISLEVDSYHHKKYGEIYFPVLEIQQWLTFETGEPAQIKETPQSDTETEQAEAIASKDTEQTEVETAEEKAPTRRRRRQTRRTETPESVPHSNGRNGMAQNKRSNRRRRRQAS